MTPSEFCARILDPARLAFPFHDTPASRALLLAIAGVESGWTDRHQDGGSARGFWQFEENGIRGVLAHYASHTELSAFCVSMEIDPILGDIHEAIAWHDSLAYAVARLLLWTDPAPLPAIGDMAGAQATYLRLWRPGRPDGSRWATRYAEASAALAAA